MISHYIPPYSYTIPTFNPSFSILHNLLGQAAASISPKTGESSMIAGHSAVQSKFRTSWARSWFSWAHRGEGRLDFSGKHGK